MALHRLPEPFPSSLFRKLCKSLINSFAIPENVNAQGTPLEEKENPFEIFFSSITRTAIRSILGSSQNQEISGLRDQSYHDAFAINYVWPNVQGLKPENILPLQFPM